jgi:hypothetical protein
MLEHIEFAGVHSGDAAMVLPAHTLSKKVIDKIREYTHAMARELKVIGLMNVQYAVKNDVVYVLEVNPRASRTVPFVSKAIGVPLAKLASRLMAGSTLKELGFTQEIWPKYWAVKESVFPFNRFHGQDILLSPKCVPRRGHGARCGPWNCLREISNGGGRSPALERPNFPERERCAQGARRGGGKIFCGPGF